MGRALWKISAPPKIKVFIWKALSGAVPVIDNLKARGMKCDDVCQTCGREGESVNHVLFEYTFARHVWALSSFPSPSGSFDEESIFVNINYLLLNWKRRKEMTGITISFPWIIWYLWKNRNFMLFEGFLFNSEQICIKAAEEADMWYASQEDEERYGEVRSESLRQEADVRRAPPENVLKCNIGVVWGEEK